MQTYLRVKQIDTGHELSIPQTQYDFEPDAYDVLDKPAVDTGGAPLSAKYKTSVSAEATKKAAASTKEKN